MWAKMKKIVKVKELYNGHRFGLVTGLWKNRSFTATIPF